MKKTVFLIVLMTTSMICYSQDWFRFNDYQVDNERIIANEDYPEVVFMGNSITENWALFHPEFFKDNNYCGRGIGGQTSAHMLVRFQSDVIALHPKAVVIMAGTNDVAHNQFYVAPKEVVNNVVSMCTLAQANGIIPILCSIPPCKGFVWNPEIQDAGQTIAAINKELKAYAEANGIAYVDCHAALADEDLGFPKPLSDDGCHPNPDTYYIIEGMVQTVLRDILKK